MYNELHKVLKHIADYIESSELPQVFSELSQFYEKVALESSEEINQQIKEQHKKIKELQSSFETEITDYQSMQVLQKFDQEGVLGNRGMDTLKKRLSSATNNPRATAQAMQELANQISELLKRSKNATESLSLVFGNTGDDTSTQVTLQIVFEGKVSVNTFDAMEEQAKFWAQIVNLIKQIIPPANGEEMTIVSIYKSSPATITLNGNVVYIMLIAQCFSFALGIKGELLNHKKLEIDIELAEIELQEKRAILQNLKSSESKTLEKKVTESVAQLAEKNKEVFPDGPQNNVAINAGGIIIKKLYNFSISGGHVSVFDDSDIEESQNSDVLSLEKKYQDLEKLKESLHNPQLPSAKFRIEEEQTMESVTSTETESDSTEPTQNQNVAKEEETRIKE